MSDNLYFDSIVEHLALHVQNQPDKVALIVKNVRYSYSDIWNRVLRYAALLKRHGVCKGDRVLLHASRSVSYITSYFAVTLIGAIAVPFEEDLPQQGAQELSARVGARVAVSEFDIEGIDTVALATDAMGADSITNIDEFPSHDDLAELLLTTGTTGRSKLVSLSHGAIMAVIENISVATDIQGDNIALIPMPLNHVFALRRLQTSFAIGATVVLLDGVASLKNFFKAIEAYEVTSLSLVPSALAYIEAMTKGLLSQFSGQIRFVESSSAPLPSNIRSWLRRTLPNSRLYNSYGCTESTACCMLEYSHRDDDCGCVGAPCVTARIEILDLGTGDILSEGSGRIVIGGKALMNGYWDDDVATDETLRNGFVYTNDLGYMRAGELYVQGRIDDVAIVGGHNVSPVELEDCIIRCDVISDCACVKGSDAITGDSIVLFAVKSPHVSKAQAEKCLSEYLRDELESFKIPTRIDWLDQIPRTYNGKTDRKALRSMLSAVEN